jgi:serine/threonine protein kinase
MDMDHTIISSSSSSGSSRFTLNTGTHWKQRNSNMNSNHKQKQQSGHGHHKHKRVAASTRTVVPSLLVSAILIYYYVQYEVFSFASMLQYSDTNVKQRQILVKIQPRIVIVALTNNDNDQDLYSSSSSSNDNPIQLQLVQMGSQHKSMPLPVVRTRTVYETSTSRARRIRPMLSKDTADAMNHDMTMASASSNDTDTDAYNYTNTYTAPLIPHRPTKHMVPSPFNLNLNNATQKNATREDCQPVLDWQTLSFPTCNMFHEMDMYSSFDNDSYSSTSGASYLGHGTIRDVWDVTNHINNNTSSSPGDGGGDGVVLKTLRLALGDNNAGRNANMEFSPHRQETHRRDAVASERLSWSKHVVDIYGYCAQSCLNEKLDHTLVNHLSHLKKKNVMPAMVTLRLARDAALALRDVHSVDYDTTGYVTIIHKDVTHRNYLISSDGQTLKISDFNLALFPLWDSNSPVMNGTTQAQGALTPCGIRKNDCTTYRSPEECRGDVLDEKIDLYMLGNTLYFMLTKKQPLWRVRLAAAKRRIEAGETSVIPQQYLDDNTSDDTDHTVDPAHRLLVQVIQQCWTMNPQDRPSAHEVATILSEGYDALLHRMSTASNNNNTNT